MYTKDADGKDVWQGYTTKSNLKEVTSTKESKYVTLKKNTKSFANLYFQQTKGSFDASKGVNFKVTRYYTIDGKKYYSTEQAKEAWTGYVDSSVVEDLKAEKVGTADSKVKVVKDWNTYSDHFFTKKAKLADYKDKTLTVKYIYTYGNGKKYASLYDGETWLGYANVEALKIMNATSVDITDLQNAIKDAQEVVKNDADLTGVDKVKEALDAAEKVLADAKQDNATQNQVNDAVKNIQDAIKAVKVDKADLEKEIKEIEALAKTVYLTKDQEAQLDKTLSDVQKVADDLSQENFDAVKKAQQTLVKAKEELQKQPSATEGNALNDALQKAQKLSKVEQYGDILFQNFGLLKSAYSDAEKTMNELKKDSEKENTATKPLTAADVKKVTDALNDALNNLQLNAENTKWFCDTAKKAITKLDKTDQETANKAFQEFVDTVKKGTAGDYNKILETANNLVNAINDAQNKELAAIIEKADRIVKENDEAKPGNQSTEGQDFYTKKSYDAFKSALEDAKKALKLQISDINKDNLHDKQITENALKRATKNLTIAHWLYKEEANKIVLTSYIPLDVHNKENLEIPSSTNNKNSIETAFRKDKIVIPGKLKDKPVELNITDQKDKSGASIIKNNDLDKLDSNHGAGVKLDGKEYYVAPDKVSVTFKAVDNQKVTTGDSLYRTFYILGSVDVTGLDTSNVKTFNETFGKYVGTTIKGIEGLNTQNAESFNYMFSEANKLETLDLSKWNMSKAKSIAYMFNNTKALKHLDLGGWDLSTFDDKTEKGLNGVFGRSDRDTLSGLIKIENKKLEEKNTDKTVKVEGLTYPTNEHIELALFHSVMIGHTVPMK